MAEKNMSKLWVNNNVVPLHMKHWNSDILIPDTVMFFPLWLWRRWIYSLTYKSPHGKHTHMCMCMHKKWHHKTKPHVYWSFDIFICCSFVFSTRTFIILNDKLKSTKSWSFFNSVLANVCIAFWNILDVKSFEVALIDKQCKHSS